jgi:hypothetical protein
MSTVVVVIAATAVIANVRAIKALESGEARLSCVSHSVLGPARRFSSQWKAARVPEVGREHYYEIKHLLQSI